MNPSSGGRPESDVPFLTSEEINKLFYFYKYDGKDFDFVGKKKAKPITVVISVPILTQLAYEATGHIVRVDVRNDTGAFSKPYFISQINTQQEADELIKLQVKELLNLST